MLRLLPLALAAALSLPAQGQIHPFDIGALNRTDQFQFLSPMLQGVEVVSLGESLHLTREFPLVRLGLIRYLHERLGFHLLAMERSAEDLWAAQDEVLDFPKTPA